MFMQEMRLLSRTRDWGGITLLHKMTALRYEDDVEWLLQVGADSFALTHLKQTLLHRAAACGHVEAVNILLESMKQVHPTPMFTRES